MKFKSSHIKSDNFLRSNNKPVKKSFKKHARQSMKIDSEDNDMTDTTTSSGINFGSDVLMHSISKRCDNVHKKIPTFKLMRTKAISRKGKEFKSFKINHTFKSSRRLVIN